MDWIDWKPMEQAPKGDRVYAKDVDGQEAWTWHDGTDWTRECWRETEDQQEYMSEEWWSPTEYAAGI